MKKINIKKLREKNGSKVISSEEVLTGKRKVIIENSKEE